MDNPFFDYFVLQTLEIHSKFLLSITEYSPFMLFTVHYYQSFCVTLPLECNNYSLYIPLL